MMRLSDEELAARKRRNLWLALALVAFMVVVFTTTFLRLSHNRQEAQAALPTATTSQGVR